MSERAYSIMARADARAGARSRARPRAYTRGVRRAGLSLLLILGGLAACSPARPTSKLGYPRIFVHVTGGYERASWELDVDGAGAFVYRSEGDDGGGTIHTRTCVGTFPRERLQALADALEAAPLAADYARASALAREHPRDGGVVNERVMVGRAVSREERRFPVTLEDYEQLRALGGALIDGYGESPPEQTCTASKRAPRR